MNVTVKILEKIDTLSDRIDTLSDRIERLEGKETKPDDNTDDDVITIKARKVRVRDWEDVVWVNTYAIGDTLHDSPPAHLHTVVDPYFRCEFERGEKIVMVTYRYMIEGWD